MTIARGCTCTPSARRWQPDGTCKACGQRPIERQLEPVLLALLCGGTGLVLWRNQSGHARYDANGREWHVDYGVGNPPGGGGDYVGIWAHGGGRWVEVEMKASLGRLSAKQRARGALVTRLNGVYAIVRSEADARELLAYLRGQTPRPRFVFAPVTTETA